MKQRDIVKRLQKKTFRLLRHGRSHDLYINDNGDIEEIPRHKEVNEKLAKHILDKWGA